MAIKIKLKQVAGKRSIFRSDVDLDPAVEKLMKVPVKQPPPILAVNESRVVDPKSVDEIDDLRDQGLLGYSQRGRPPKFLFYVEYARRFDVRAIPYAFYRREKAAWELPVCRKTLKMIYEGWPNFVATRRALEVATEERRLSSIEIKFLKDLDQIRQGNFDPEAVEGYGVFQPRLYQKLFIAAAELAWDQGFSIANHDEQGLGKTCATLILLDRIAKNDPTASFAISCPKSLMYSVWVKEATKFTRHLRPLVLDGSIEHRARLIENLPYYDWADEVLDDGLVQTRYKRVNGAPNLFLFNHELGSYRDKRNPKNHNPAIQRLIDANLRVFVVDEYHKIANQQSKRGKALKALRLASDNALGLTGTPGLPKEVYGEMTWLSHRIFPVNLGDFKSRYINEIQLGETDRTKTIGFKNLDELAKIVRWWSIRREQKDVLDLPPSTREQRLLTMTAAQSKAYDAVVEDTILHFQSKAITASSMSAKLHMLRNITGGHLKVAEGQKIRFKDHVKLQELKDIYEETCTNETEELVRKIVVACHYREDVELVESFCKQSGIKYVAIHGDIVDTAKNKRRSNAAAKFNEDPKVKILVGITSTFGVGLNLVPRLPMVCDTMVFYSSSHDPKERDQAEKRIERDPQTRMCRFIDLMCRGTIDEAIIAAVLQKKSITRIVTGDNMRAILRGQINNG